MRFWIFCFLVLFGATQLFPGIAGINAGSLLLWGLGLGLAIASNANKISGLPRLPPSRSTLPAPATRAAEPAIAAAEPVQQTSPPEPAIAVAEPVQQTSPQLPAIQPASPPPPKSISFTIKKSP